MIRTTYFSKPIRSAARMITMLCASWLVCIASSSSSLAAPQGATPRAGDVNINQSGATTTITAGRNAIIDYQSFNIARHETVRFIQPSATARVLNRVLNGQATQVNGRLIGNGHVYLINPAGIYFGNDAIVNVGHLTAAAGTITNSDFLAGVDRFTHVDGSVINTGTLEGRTITLIGNHVANRGLIVAPEGMVTLAAGNTVYLTRTDGGMMVELSGGTDTPGQAAVENSGTINAPGGTVNLGASDVYTLAARHDGTTVANEVNITTDGGRAEVGGTIDASNPEGVGGRVIIVADDAALTESAYIDVSGQVGGFVELSGRLDLSIAGVVNRLGSTGQNGTLLLDPKNIIIALAGGITPLAGSNFTDDPTGTVTFLPQAVVDALALGDVMLQANNDIKITDTIDASANGTRGSLYLVAGRSILINADVLLNGDLEAEANASLDWPIVFAERDPGAAVITMGPDVLIDTSAGDGSIQLDLGPGYGQTNFASGDLTIERLYAGFGWIDIEHTGRTPGSGIVINDATNVPGKSANVVAEDFGNISVEMQDISGTNTTGGVTIAGRLSTVDGQMHIDPPATVTLTPTARLTATGSGAIYIEGNSVDMQDGSAVTTFDGWVEIIAFTGDVNVSQINVFSGVPDGVRISAPMGSINDAGDADPLGYGTSDLNVFDGATSASNGASLYAKNGIGAAGPNGAIETNHPELYAHTDNANQAFNLVGLNSFGFFAGTGTVTVNATGDLADDDGGYDIIADTVDLSVGGSITDPGIANHPDANPNAVDFQVANVGGSTFNVSGTNDAVVNAAPIDVTITTPITSADPYIGTTGSVTIDADITPTTGTDGILIDADSFVTVNANLNTTGAGTPITIYTGGLLTVGGDILSGDQVRIDAQGGMTFTGPHTVRASQGVLDISIEPLAPPAPVALTMVDGALIDADGDFEVFIDVFGDFTVGSVESSRVASNGEVGIEVYATGAIIDGGDSAIDFISPNAEVEAYAHTGLGTLANAIETQTKQLEIGNVDSGNVNVFNTGDVVLEDVSNQSSGGFIQVAAASSVTYEGGHSNGGTLSITATDNIFIDGVIPFASTVLLRAGTDGTGQVAWLFQGANRRGGIAADQIDLRAGDGPGGSTTALVDTATQPLFFTNAALDGNPTSFAVQQDADIDTETDGPPVDAFIFGGGSISGMTFAWQVDDGNLRLFDDNGSEQAVATAIATQGNVTLAGTLIAPLLNVTAGNNIIVDADITITGPINAINFDAGNAITMTDGKAVDGGASNVDFIAGAGGVMLSQIATTSADGNAIGIVSAGPVTDAGDADPLSNGGADLHAPNGNVAVDAGANDIGTALDSIEVNVSAPIPGNFTGGNVFVDFGSGDIDLTTPINNGNDNTVQQFTTTGNLMINATVTTSGSDSGIDLNADGEVQVNQALTTTGLNSSIDITSGMDTIIAADLSAGAGGSDISISSDGDITIATETTLSSPNGQIALTTDANNDAVGGILTVDGDVQSPLILIDTREITHTASSLNAGATGRVEITGKADQMIQIGTAHDDTATPLEIDQSILDVITAALLEINSLSDAGIDIGTPVVLNHIDGLRLNSAGPIASDTVTVNKLALDGTAIDVKTAVSEIAANGSSLIINNTGDLAVTTVDGLSGLTSGGGVLVIETVAGNLTGTGPINLPAGGAAFEVDGSINLTGPLNLGETRFTVAAGGDILLPNTANILTGGPTFGADSGHLNDLVIVLVPPITVGDTFVDGRLEITSTGGITLEGPNLGSTGGNVIFNSDITLMPSVGNVVTVSGSNVTFRGRINSDTQATPRQLTVNTFDSGTTRFVGTVGAGPNDSLDSNVVTGVVGGDDLPLSRLETNADGQTIIGALQIILDGSSAQFDNPAQITNDVEITELGTGDITFGGTVDAAPGTNSDLTINQTGPGDVNFTADVGSSTPLNTLTVNTQTGGGQTNVQGDVTTTGTQEWNTPVEAGPGTTLTGGDVNLNNGTTPGSAEPRIVEVALDTTNVAELLPGQDGGASSNHRETGPVSELAQLLMSKGIDVPAALQGRDVGRRLQAAVDDYLLDLEIGADIEPQGFVNYIAQRRNHRQTMLVLMALRDVIENIDAADLPDAEKATLRTRVMDQLKPPGLTLNQFKAVLELLPRPGTVALVS
jgi:filamentous hemagglutinin family protein